MNVDTILAELVQRDGFHVTELAAELLKLCRRHADVLRARLLDPTTSSTRKNLRSQVAAVVRDRGLLDSDDANALQRLSQQASMDQLSDEVIARCIAEGIEIGAGQFFADWFIDDRDLHAHDPFPVALSQPRKWIRSGRSSGNPTTRTEPLDRLDRLRLVPADTRGIRITLRQLPAHLAQLEHIERFGIGVLEDPQLIETKFHWERYSIDGERLFFGVRPAAPDVMVQRITDISRQAAERGVDLLLLPELCMTEDMHKALVDSNVFASIPFVVAGSHHLPATVGPGHNRATLFARGRPLSTHHKFRPVVFPDTFEDDGSPASKLIPRQEHLLPSNACITVLASGDWSVAILICKDAMENAVHDLLRDLAVQLVLIPAMSPKADDFADLASLLGRDPQSFTLVGNLGATVAIIGTPAECDRVRTHSYDGIGLKVFDREGRLLID